MTQAYLNGSTGRKSQREGRKSNTGGSHGGPQDEGPCRDHLDDHNRAQPATPKGYGHNPFRFLMSLFAAIVSETKQEAAKRKAEIRAKRRADEDRKTEQALRLWYQLARYRRVTQDAVVCHKKSQAFKKWRTVVLEVQAAVKTRNESRAAQAYQKGRLVREAEPAALAKAIDNEAIVHNSCASEKAASSLSISCATEGKDSRFGTRPAGKISLEGDGVGYGKNRVLSKTTQVATDALSVKVNAIAEATVANAEFYYCRYSSSTAADVAVAKLDVEATTDATEALSGKVGAASAEATFDEVKELASSAFVKAEVKESESPPTASTKGLGFPIKIRDLTLSVLKNHPHPTKVALPEVSNHRAYPHGRKKILSAEYTTSQKFNKRVLPKADQIFGLRSFIFPKSINSL